MSRKTCRRVHYALVNPIRCAIEGAGVAQDSLLDKLRILELSAIESFAKGRATTDDWRAVADFCNIAETMALGGVGPEVLEACAAAGAALTGAYRRHAAIGRLGVTGPQLQALRDLYQFHDLQRSSIARSEYERYIRMTADRIRSAHPSLKVFI